MSIANLGYAPYLRPGALLFTLTAFRHFQIGRGCKGKANDDLFGNIGNRKRNLFGEHVANVAERAFGNSLTPEDVLLKHTLFGVYSRALPPTIATAWSAGIIAESKSHNIPKLLSYSPRLLRLVTRDLRSCPRCVAEDTALCGFGQWRVLHHIPSVLFCPEHGLPLNEEAQGDFFGDLWQYVLPHGRNTSPVSRAPWAASDGHATYLRLWTKLFDGELPVLRGHAWAAYMDHVTDQLGDAAPTQIENTIRKTWSIDSVNIKSALGPQIKKDFVRSELSHDSSPARLAQKLIVLGATTAMGIVPLQIDETSQLRLDLSYQVENNGAVPLQAQFRDFLLDASLPGSMAELLMTFQYVREIARTADIHRNRIRRTIERIPDELLDRIASAQNWPSRSWVANERFRRRDKRLSRLG